MDANVILSITLRRTDRSGDHGRRIELHRRATGYVVRTIRGAWENLTEVDREVEFSFSSVKRLRLAFDAAIRYNTLNEKGRYVVAVPESISLWATDEERAALGHAAWWQPKPAAPDETAQMAIHAGFVVAGDGVGWFDQLMGAAA